MLGNFGNGLAADDGERVLQVIRSCDLHQMMPTASTPMYELSATLMTSTLGQSKRPTTHEMRTPSCKFGA